MPGENGNQGAGQNAADNNGGQAGSQSNAGTGSGGQGQGTGQAAGQGQQQPNAGQQAGTQSQQGQGQQGQQQQQQAPAPFASFPDAKSFETRMRREARKLMNAQARESGFEDWDDMAAELASKAGTAGTAGKQPGKTAGSREAENSQADRLQMALDVGAKLNLPVALVRRLQGSTPEEMEADAQQLLSLMGQTQGQGGQQGQQGQRPGIPAAQNNQQVTTFTRAQLQDAKFVREHAEEIRKAAREGRITNS